MNIEYVYWLFIADDSHDTERTYSISPCTVFTLKFHYSDFRHVSNDRESNSNIGEKESILFLITLLIFTSSLTIICHKETDVLLCPVEPAGTLTE